MNIEETHSLHRRTIQSQQPPIFEIMPDSSSNNNPPHITDSAAITAAEEEKETFFRLAPFNPSSQQIQDKALEHLKLSNRDVLFDLGCGDGRLLCHAVQQVPGLRCVGIEIDALYVERAQHRVKELLPSVEAQSQIEIRCEDALSALDIEQHDASATSTISSPSRPDNNKPAATTKPLKELTLLEDATALYLFVLPKGLQKLLPILEAVVERRQQEQRQFRILSYMFQIHHDQWEPALVDRTAKGGCPIYVYEWMDGKEMRG